MLAISPCDESIYASELVREAYMDRMAVEAYNKLNGAVNYYFAPEFGRILATCLKEGNDDAEIICRSLNLTEQHMASLINDNEWFDQACNG